MNATYTYDRLNQLTSVTIGGDTTTYGYDDNGNILNKTTGELVTAYTYNQGNLLTNMETTHPDQSGAVSSYTATYYVDGNVKSKQDDSERASYTYDGLNRLVEDNGTKPTTYMYDAYGNISQKSKQIAGPQNEITTYTYNANNQLVRATERYFDYTDESAETSTTTRYAYDANGNVTSKIPQKIKHYVGVEAGISISMTGETELPDYLTMEQYTYDGFGQRTKAVVNDKTVEYAYNPDGLRVSKTVNGETTTHILDGANVVADIQGTSISKYNRGRDLISMEQNGQKGLSVKLKCGSRGQYYVAPCPKQ